MDLENFLTFPEDLLMTQKPKPEKPDLSEHEEEAVPFDEVMQKLLKAKPEPKKAEQPKEPKK